ncbi:MAG TPA: hypothetical protein PKJ69_01220 [Spirochaetota bacterium]|nr:hypothetical protein [Spirochaetota bacterium]
MDNNDRSLSIFGNPIPEHTYNKAMKQKARFAKKFGYNPEDSYELQAQPNPILKKYCNLYTVSQEKGAEIAKSKSIIIGTIRMGYGHYRIAMAIASAAHSMGIVPYWFDLLSFDTAGAKIIKHMDKLYSLGSRLSQQFYLFNKLYWEHLTAIGFKKLTYNATDQAMTQLFANIYRNLPQSVPFVATHAWASQAAVHAGTKKVINMIPDNWPLALHLSEGAIHTVQTPSAYFGYRTLKNMGKKNQILNPMPKDDIYYTGHYVDHELVANIEKDCNARLARIKNKKPRRFLLSIGGAGAQQKLCMDIIAHCIPLLENEKLTLIINTGDHKAIFDMIVNTRFSSRVSMTTYTQWVDIEKLANTLTTKDLPGLHIVHNEDIFSAVYATNILMRVSDCLITKPGELAFYPVPKLFVARVGGHEMWGAIRGAEIGDSTVECETIQHTLQAMDLLIYDDDLLTLYCNNIIKAKSIGIYNGAYEVIKLAFGK